MSMTTTPSGRDRGLLAAADEQLVDDESLDFAERLRSAIEEDDDDDLFGDDDIVELDEDELGEDDDDELADDDDDLVDLDD